MNVRIRSIPLAVIIALGLVSALSAAGPIQLHGSGDTVNVAICAGASQVFTVDASGSNVHYQWKKGAENVGTDSSSYEAIEAGDYTCVVTGDCGEATSAEALVTMKAETVIH